MDYILGGPWTIGFALGYGHWQLFVFNNLALSFSACLLTCRSSPFLCLSAAQVWLRADSMDGTPFVNFLPGNTYGMKDDFLGDVSAGGQPHQRCVRH